MPNAPSPESPSPSVPLEERTDVPPDNVTPCAQVVLEGRCNDDGMTGYCNTSCERYVVATLNPNATQATRNLLNYLYSISGKQVLSGQQEHSWGKAVESMQFYKNLVGDYPAVIGGDFLYPGAEPGAENAGNPIAQGTTDRMIAYAQAGGIVMLRYHMGAPPQADSFAASQSSTNMNAVVTPGTAEHTSLLVKLDYAAAELQRLEDQNIPVLWAPYHEFQPGGWFWWAKGTAEQFHALWDFTYEYLTNTKGLDNLIWIAPFSKDPAASWLPPRYDLAGPDQYFPASEQPFTSLYDEMLDIVPAGMPMVLHETGTIPQPADMFATGTHWVLWNVWMDFYDDTSRNTTQSIQAAYADERTITRSEVPSFE